jgi:hypothetical protein
MTPKYVVLANHTPENSGLQAKRQKSTNLTRAPSTFGLCRNVEKLSARFVA